MKGLTTALKATKQIVSLWTCPSVEREANFIFCRSCAKKLREYYSTRIQGSNCIEGNTLRCRLDNYHEK